MRVVLGAQYDGTQFSGWQIQPSCLTVQGCLEDALTQVADHAVKTVAAGRTDAGVHALQQVVHFITTAKRDDRSWVLGLNANLPPDISIVWAKQVDDDFNARFSAISRRYRYIIFNQLYRPAVHRDRVWWCFNPLDEIAMQSAANLLIGHHDFSAFRSKLCQADSPIKTVDNIEVTRQGDYIAIDVKARSFLYRMVRNIVGVLALIGEGKKPVEWARQVLDSRDRSKGAMTAPPQGLYFIDAKYPARYELPTVSTLPMVW